MATYSNNETIKIGSTIDVTSSAASGTLYTVPANSYLHLTKYSFARSAIFGTSTATATIGNLGTVSVSSGTSAASIAFDSLTGTLTRSGMADIIPGSSPLIVGPGQTITFSYSSSGGSPVSTSNIKGILFVNTP